MIDMIGYIAAFAFAICAVPQAMLSYRYGHSKGVSGLTLILWSVGEVLMTIYVYFKHGLDIPLLSNYLFNMLSLVVIIYYKVKPRS